MAQDRLIPSLCEELQAHFKMSDWLDRKVLITGISGFTGRHLLHSLLPEKARIAGFDLAIDFKNDDVKSFTGSLLNQHRIDEVIAATRPEIIFHLAGILKTDLPEQFYTINVGGTAALLEAIVRSGQLPRLILFSSSAVYGESRGVNPISEAKTVEPLTSYGHSKLAMEWIAKSYAAEYDIPIVLCRPFNLVGPGLAATMVLSSFARQLACAERGLKKTIEVGNLEARRDFLDVRDGVQAYRLLAEHGQAGETYNVCSGQAISIRVCLEILLSFSDTRPDIVHDPNRIQKDDLVVQVGDSSKIHALTGWEPRIPLEKSLKDLLDDWRGRADACE